MRNLLIKIRKRYNRDEIHGKSKRHKKRNEEDREKISKGKKKGEAREEDGKGIKLKDSCEK